MNKFELLPICVVLLGMIIYFSVRPYKSHAGERIQLAHGPIASARGREKSERRGCLLTLWFLFVASLIFWAMQT
jgi:hypothetical protein